MNIEQLKRLKELKELEAQGSVTGDQTKELAALLELEKKDVELKKGEKITREFDCETKIIDEDKYELEAIASTNSIDRYGDIVEQSSWDLKKYKKNPVILANHFYTVQNIIGRATKVWVDGDKLKMRVKFAVNESELAKSVWKLIVGGYLKAWSVGFIPKEWDDVKDDKTGKYTTTLKNCELLEVSAVAVPANADCLTNAVKSGALSKVEAKTAREAFGEDFAKKEKEFAEKKELELAQKNKEILKAYRAAIKKLNGILNIKPTGDEQKDLEKTIEMNVYCLGLDDGDEIVDDLNNTKKTTDDNLNKPAANPSEVKARTATQEDLNRIQKSILS